MAGPPGPAEDPQPPLGEVHVRQAEKEAGKGLQSSRARDCQTHVLLSEALLGQVLRVGEQRYSDTVACDRTYEAYGPGLPVSVILRKMKAHRRSGDWPGLIVVRAE